MHRRFAAATAALVLIIGLALPSAPVHADARPGSTYTNPVSPPAADAFGSPSMIRGRDGFWYAYGPGNPMHAGDPRPNLPILRSPDLVHWDYVGDVFSDDTIPAWKGDAPCCMWAPDIEYFDGAYRLYYTFTNIAGYPRPSYAIGVATAPTPTGPWTDKGGPLVAPKKWTVPGRGDTRYRTIIDADVMTAPDGSRYLYYGGFGGGIYGIRLSADGMSTVGEEVRLATDSTYEGPYVIHRGHWYYLFVSSGSCCKGPVAGYAVFAGRSRDPLGPFVDRQGARLDARSPGGTPVLAANGNRWVGTGHNAAITDLGGQDWFGYEAIDRHDPYLSGTRGEVRRPMLIDRLDWIDGWPTVRAGAWASDHPTAAPTVSGPVVDAFEESTLSKVWRPADGWRLEREAAGGYAHGAAAQGATSLLPATVTTTGDVRARADVRVAGGAAGIRLSDGVSAVIDRSGRELVLAVRHGGTTSTTTASLPGSFDYGTWHTLAVDRRGGRLTAQVSDAGLFDPVATASVGLPEGVRDGAPALEVTSGAADFDDVSVAPLTTPVTTARPEPQAGTPIPSLSDEFAGRLAPGSTWIRKPAATVQQGRLVFPVQHADLTGSSNSASLLVRDVPDNTSWVAETKVRLDFGTDDYADFPQAGLIAYVNDDDYLRLTTRANRDVVVASYQKEMPWAGGTIANAGTVGPTATTTWLRFAHTVDPVTGEHDLRAGVSRDSRTWTWGAVQTLPAGSDIKIALGAQGSAAPLVASFDYLRVYALR